MKDVCPSVYLIDDDERVRRSVARLLLSEGYVVSLHPSAEDFLEHHDACAPGCAILDLGLPGIDGLEVQDLLRTKGVIRPLIFLTGRGDIPASVQAMKAGAVDFLTKPVDASVLLAAVAGAIERDRRERRDGEQRLSVAARFSSLTPREREVLKQVVAGRLNKQIAFDLGTAVKTVKVHRGRMMKKMGVRSVADLVRLVAPLPI